MITIKPYTEEHKTQWNRGEPMVKASQLQTRFYKNEVHPYRIYEEKIDSVLCKTDVLLDAGCGRDVPVLRKFKNKAAMLIGVDLEDPTELLPGIRLIKGDISEIDLKDNYVDVVISRAVLEHVKDPLFVFNEINRILKPGGSFIFLVPNLGDYASLISYIIPNRFHSWIVSKTEGRKEHDVFPAYYKANTYKAIRELSKKTGFNIVDFKFLGQYPSYFMFNSILFLVATVYEKFTSKFDFLRLLRGWILAHLTKRG